MTLLSRFGRTSMAGGLLAVIAACSGAVSSALPPTAPASTAAATTAPPASPGASRTGLPGGATIARWDPLADIPAMKGSLVGAAGAAPGYVLAWAYRDVAFSVDGKTWLTSKLPFDDRTSSAGFKMTAQAIAVASNGDGWIVVGAYDGEPCGPAAPGGAVPEADGGLLSAGAVILADDLVACRRHPIAWTSADGIHWRSSVDHAMPSDASGKPERGEFSGAWWDGAAWIGAIELRESVIYQGNSLVRSTDGLTWTRIPAPPHVTGVPADVLPEIHGGLVEGNGVSHVWQVWRAWEGPPVATLSRLNGTTWTTEAFEGSGAIVKFGIGPLAPGQPWVLAGLVEPPAGGRPPMVWVSNPDGGPPASRTLTVDDPLANPDAPPVITGIARSGAGFYVVTGLLRGLGTGVATWTSTDGTTWVAVHDPALAQASFSSLFALDGPHGLLLVGESDDGPRAWVAVPA